MNAPAPMIQFKRELSKLSADLPTSKDIPVEKMESALIVAAQKNPKLLTADRSTLWLSVRQCAADGLLPDGREAALVIFKTKLNDKFVDAVQYIPMVFGLRKRAMKSGEVKDINAVVVYQGEWEAGRFVYVEGDEPRIEHRPILPGAPGEPDRGEPIGAYAIATFKDGHKVRDWIPAEDIERIRRASPSQKVYKKGKKPEVSDVPLGVWEEWWDEQWKKSAVRRVSKKLPLSSEDQRMIQESEAFDLKDITPDEPEPERLSFRDRANAAKKAEREQPETEQTIEGESQEIDTQADEATPEAEASSSSRKGSTGASKAKKSSKSAKPSQKKEQKKEADKSAGDGAEQSDGPSAEDLSKARTAGAGAFHEGFAVDQCPHPKGPLHDEWVAGWKEEEEAAG